MSDELVTLKNDALDGRTIEVPRLAAGHLKGRGWEEVIPGPPTPTEAPSEAPAEEPAPKAAKREGDR